MHCYRILLDEQGSEGNGTTQDDGRDRKADPDAAFQRLLDKKNGDGIILARQLFSENYEYRRDLADLRAKVPGSDSRVVSVSDAALLDSYRSLGKPEDIRKSQREREEFASEVAASRRDKAVAEFGKKAGVDPDKFALLARLAGNAEFAVAREKGKDGKEIEVVTVKDGDGDPRPFDDYFADALPALRPDAGKAASRGTPAHGANYAGRPPANQRTGTGQLDPDNPDHLRQSFQQSGIAGY